MGNRLARLFCKELLLAFGFAAACASVCAIHLIAIFCALALDVSSPFRAQMELVSERTLAAATLGTFVLAPLLLVAAFGWAWRREKKLKREFPSQPWRHRSDWSKGRSEHGAWQWAVMWSWLAIFVTTMIGGVTTGIALTKLSATGLSWRALDVAFMLPFLFLNFGIVVYTALAIMDAIRWREVSCELVNMPMCPGDAVRCVVDWGSHVPNLDNLAVELQCSTPQIAPSRDDEGEGYQLSHYMTRHRVAVTTEGPLPVRFSLPAEAPPTRGDDSTEWTLALCWPGPMGWTRRMLFKLPVFVCDDPPDAVTSDFDAKYRGANGLSAVAALESLADLVLWHGGKTETVPGDGEHTGCEVELPPSNLLFSFAGRSRHCLKWEANGVSLRRPAVLFQRDEHLSWSEIRSIRQRQSERSKYGFGLHEVVAELQSGGHVVVLADAHSRVLARVITSHLINAMEQFAQASCPTESANA